LVISIIPASLIVVDTGKTIMAGGYIASFQSESLTGVSAGPQVIGMFIVPACLFLLAGAKGRRRERTTAAIVIGLYTLVQLSLGDRSGAIMAACAFGWLWHQCEGQIKARWLIGAGLVVMMVIVPIIRETRGLAGPDRMKLETLKNAYLSIENPIVSSISEMGGSMATIAHTYTLVPGTRAFDNGTSYAYAALTVVPNLFWNVHPTISHGTAQHWLVQTVDPYVAARGGGLGFSGVAEAYLNFGWVGVPIVLGLVGFGMGRLTTWASRGANPRQLAMVAAFTAFVLKFPRDETASLVRFFAWYSWAPYAIATLIAAFAARQAFLASQRVIGLGPEASGAGSL
jgi:oligosaccharide repeat unit polymerase